MPQCVHGPHVRPLRTVIVRDKIHITRVSTCRQLPWTVCQLKQTQTKRDCLAQYDSNHSSGRPESEPNNTNHFFAPHTGRGNWAQRPFVLFTSEGYVISVSWFLFYLIKREVRCDGVNTTVKTCCNGGAGRIKRTLTWETTFDWRWPSGLNIYHRTHQRFEFQICWLFWW